jgi:hypothetical protein
MANELEPWREFQAAIVEHGLQFVRGNISGISNLVQVWLEVNLGFNEEDVVNYKIQATSAGPFNI